MRIGFITRYDRVDDMDWAAANRFFGLELMCWYSDGLLESAETVKRNMDERGLEIITMGFWGNNLDPTERVAWQRRQAGVIDLAAKWGVKKVATFAGRDQTTDMDGNLRAFKAFWSPLAKRAEDNGVQICFENCPMFDPRSLKSINIATNPAVWERMFNEVDSPALGLQFDPSHLYWLQVDHIAALREFAPKIGLVHAKDTEILPDALARTGILSRGWWRYRLPGLGSIDWKSFLGVLKEIGYQGDVAIEHEDPLYEGEKAHEGLLLARNNLESSFGGR
jgi:sugar phosphate isomerase/epimerase